MHNVYIQDKALYRIPLTIAVMYYEESLDKLFPE